jgi:transcription-repair coupling factor (superfamily II helicase)
MAGELRSLLELAGDDEGAMRLASEGGRAFVSSSLRPYLIAALAEADEEARARPLLVVVGDDRAARDLAGDLGAWLAPRRVRYYPSRGVAYESHLAPPPHLVGLRVAALDSLLAAEAAGSSAPAGQPVVVVSAVALSEKVPDPDLRPRAFTLAVGELLDLDECAGELVAAGYERVEQVEERGQFALRGGILDIFPATEERAVRVDMFDVEIESLRWFSTFTQRSLGDVQQVEIAPAAELAVEPASWRRSLPRRVRSTPTARASGRTSPSSSPWSASVRCSTSSARPPACSSPPRRTSSRC